MFGAQHAYIVYLKPQDDHPLETVEFVRDGFTFFGFIFGIFWLLWHQVWREAAAFFIATLLLAGLQFSGLLSEAQSSTLQMGLMLAVGFYGRQWWGNALARRGYEAYDLVYATSQDEAEARFFGRYCAEQAAYEREEKPIPLLSGVGW